MSTTLGHLGGKSVPLDDASPKVPIVPGALPVIGHLKAFLKDPVKLAHYAYESSGEVCELKVPGKRLFLFTGPDAHDFVLNAGDDEFSMSDIFKFVLPSFFGPNFKHDAKVDFPYAHTRMFTPALFEHKMKQYATTIHHVVEQVLAEAGAVEDLYDLGKRIFLRTASRCFFGKGVSAAQFESFSRFYADMAGALSFRSMIAGRFGLHFFTRAEKARLSIVKILAEVIAASPGDGGEDDLIGVMRATPHPTGRPQTLDEIAGNCLQLLFAAHTPTAVAFAWTGVELARHPEWSAEVKGEVDAVWQKVGDAAPTYQDIRTLKFLDWSVQETLRLHSPPAFHARSARVDMNFKGYKIPKGAVVLIAPAVSHSLPKYFPEPERFDPSRFAPERRERKGHPMALVTFGGGPHRCIGTAFAMLQLNLAWANVLRRFDVEMLDEVRPKYAGLLMMPSQPCRARLILRT